MATPKRIGRPPRATKAATERLELRLTVEERKQLERAAGDHPLAEWVRNAALAATR